MILLGKLSHNYTLKYCWKFGTGKVQKSLIANNK